MSRRSAGWNRRRPPAVGHGAGGKQPASAQAPVWLRDGERRRHLGDDPVDSSLCRLRRPLRVRTIRDCRGSSPDETWSSASHMCGRKTAATSRRTHMSVRRPTRLHGKSPRVRVAIRCGAQHGVAARVVGPHDPREVTTCVLHATRPADCRACRCTAREPRRPTAWTPVRCHDRRDGLERRVSGVRRGHGAAMAWAIMSKALYWAVRSIAAEPLIEGVDHPRVDGAQPS